ncbi:MAG: hypothetical protein AAGF97_02510 [Planctomycetota bacterium]
MNASSNSFNDDFDQAVSFRRSSSTSGTTNANRAKRGSFGRRRGKGPQQFNGIHRRRTKKISW